MVFDTWGGNLTPAAYQAFSLTYSRKVLAGLSAKESEGRRVPNILFTKGGGQWLEAMAAIGCDALGVDWSTDLGQARERVGGAWPCKATSIRALFAPAERVRHEARRVLDAYGARPGHVFNLGHGISQFTPPENVAALVDEVHTYSKKLRSA
jgi:uroporphyrinogen decarboxylase